MTKIMPDQEGPGSLVYVISSKTGQILKQYEVPFGKESWSVPIYKKVNGKNLLIYGSGGERTGGHFLAQDIDNGEIIWSIENKNKGFISAPLLYRESGQDFVVTNSMEGDIRKVNAKTGKEIWKKSVGSDFESYSSVTVGRFNGKEYNDIVSIFSRGVWPTYESASIYVFDGKTGDIIFKEKIGYCQSSSSPVISDLDNDLKDDILYLSCTDRYARVTVLNNQLDVIMSHPVSSGAFSTPVVMDIDNNKRLDLIIPRFHFIDRYEMVEIMSNYESSWNQYRGKLWNGVYSK